MKIIFLDFDGVLNSAQSAQFWHSRRDQTQWENNMYRDWPGTLREYIAMEFCPISLGNVEELVKRVPGVKIVVSSTWRLGETPETLKKILSPSKIVGDAIIDVTPAFRDAERGEEIKAWLDKHPEVTNYVIIDDDDDMLESQKNNFVNTDNYLGFMFHDMIKACKILCP